MLAAIAATADPDSTLVNLDKVSDSLGGKGVLWELFSFNPPSLRLYVELCAYSPHLSGILTSNPGMIDSLMDSLVLDKLPTRENMQQTLAELCRAAEDIDPILHSFKNDQQLCVGVRDILGKEDIQATTGALSDIAETCLAQIAAREYERLAARFGRPQVGEGRRAGRPCEMVILALGKFGGREMNYHSDLDVIFLYEADGHTAADAGPAARPGTTNQHFFSELGQRIIKAASQLSGYGRLYEVDARLRPTGQQRHAGHDLRRVRPLLHHRRRPALGAAGAVQGAGWSTARRAAAKAAMAAVAKAAFAHRWRRKDAVEIRQHAAAAGRHGRRGRRPETRARRHRRHRVPRADAPAQARPRQSPPPRAEHAGGARANCTARDCFPSTTMSCSTSATGCCGRSKAGCG